MPNGHKTNQERHCGEYTISLASNAAQPYASRFLPALPRLVAAYRAAGLTLHGAGPVFVKAAGGGYRLLNEPATYGVLNGVLRKRAAEANLTDEHFTGHSTRRGRMQGDRAAGVAPAATQSRALGICDATYALYTDLERPTRRRINGSAPPGAGHAAPGSDPPAVISPQPLASRVAATLAQLLPWRSRLLEESRCGDKVLIENLTRSSL